MSFFVGITDQDWIDHLRAVNAIEANFWRPSAKNFNSIKPGSIFLFKQHKRAGDDVIGGGTFYGAITLSIYEAWNTFKDANGAASLVEMIDRVAAYREKAGRTTHASDEIVCLVLKDIFFFPEESILLKPKDWSNSIVSGKTYQWESAFGKEVAQVLDIARIPKVSVVRKTVQEGAKEYDVPWGNSYLAKSRIGQGVLRLEALVNFNAKCCVSGEMITEVLECAHIRPLSQQGPHALKNTLLLRADLHRLFDLGLISVSSEGKVLLSEKIPHKSEYRILEDASVFLGVKPIDDSYLEWHRENIFCPA